MLVTGDIMCLILIYYKASEFVEGFAGIQNLLAMDAR